MSARERLRRFCLEPRAICGLRLALALEQDARWHLHAAGPRGLDAGRAHVRGLDVAMALSGRREPAAPGQLGARLRELCDCRAGEQPERGDLDRSQALDRLAVGALDRIGL